MGTTLLPGAAPATDTTEMGEPCIICKEPLELDRHDDALALQCAHTYHAACLNEWWAISHSQRCVACTREATAYRHACGAATATATLLRPGHRLAAPRPCGPCGQQKALLDALPGRDAVLARLCRALRAGQAAGAPLGALLDPEQQRSYDAMLGLPGRPDCSPAALLEYLGQEGEGLDVPGPPSLDGGTSGATSVPLPSGTASVRPVPQPSAESAVQPLAHTTNITKAVLAMMYNWLPGQKKEARDIPLVAEVEPPVESDGSLSPSCPPSWVRELCSQYCQRARVLKDWQDEYRDPSAGADVYFEMLCAFEAFWSVVKMLKAVGRGEDKRAELEVELARRLACLMWVKERGMVDGRETEQAAARRSCGLLGGDR